MYIYIMFPNDGRLKPWYHPAYASKKPGNQRCGSASRDSRRRVLFSAWHMGVSAMESYLNLETMV